MRHVAFVVVPTVLAVALACGSVKDRSGCSSSGDCPAGQGCVPTSDGNVCWADAVAPVVTGATASCGAGPCVRDGALAVTARATDDREVAAVEAALELDGHVQRVPLARSTVAGDPAGTYRGEVPLRQWAFPFFERDVVARVFARDGARNEVSADASAVVVTRVRWTYDAAAPLSAPAVMADGTVVVGRAASSDQVLAIHPDGTKAWSASVGTSFVSQPPSIGASAIWVAAGNRVFAVKLDGTAVLNGAGCDTGGAIVGPPAVSDAPAPDVAFVASAGGRVSAVAPNTAQSIDGLITRTALYDAFTTGAVIVDRGSLVAISDPGLGPAMLRHFTYDGAFLPGPTASVGEDVVLPLALDADSNAWSASADSAASAVNATTPLGSNLANIPLAASASGSVVIASGGDIVVSQSNTLRRFSPAGAARWPTPPTLGGIGLTPLVLAADPAAFLVPTRTGTIHAVDADGAVLWSGTLASAELREGNAFTATGAASGTAYFTSADGVLHAVVIDGRLDEAAPWPKAWHDARNTSNAATR